MTITVANTANTNSFYYWLSRTNELAHALTNYVVTTDSNTATGNASISGAFSATTLIVDKQAITSLNVQTSNTDSQVIDYFDKTVYRTAEYVISLKNNTGSTYQASKLLLVHDSSDAYVTEYGVLSTSTNLGSFSANANSTHCRLLFAPTVANTQLKGVRINVVV